MKAQRQAKIVEIISNANVETQEQLLQALTDQGFSSTQATISRDIKELRIVKELTRSEERRVGKECRLCAGKGRAPCAFRPAEQHFPGVRHQC